ncbi:MAG: imidazole glycerol phosphate synthase subunit HisF [archaeon]
MLTKRIIPCLDVKEGIVVKGFGFKNLREIGDPLFFAKKYYQEGADEIILLDISASAEYRKTTIELVKKIASEIFIPFCIGGGIKSIDDINALLKIGADKISICTAAVLNPDIIFKSAKKFGSQCIVLSLDAKKKGNSWEVYIYGGTKPTGLDAIEFARKCALLGCGEILVNSLDKDGTGSGYDLDLLRKLSESVNVPIIASSGAGNMEQIYCAFSKGCADAALVASIFHDNKYSIKEVKEFLKKKGLCVR